jgi:hypothetical protein
MTCARYLYNHRTNEAWKEYLTDDGEVLASFATDYIFCCKLKLSNDTTDC